MKRIFTILLVNIFLTASAGKGNGNQNNNGNGGNGNHYGWTDNTKDNPGEVGGDPDESINVPFVDYVPVLVSAGICYGLYMNRKRLQLNK